jgi:hypothetical protein
MPLSDREAKNRLRRWPRTTRIWSPGAHDIRWLMAQPVTGAVWAPRLSAPGSREFQTQPDGLWITLGIRRSDSVTRGAFVDCVVVEVCGTAQNLSDKRSRYAARTNSLMIEMHQPWLDEEVPLQAGAMRTRREVLRGQLSEEGSIVLPVRHLRILYALDDAGQMSLFDRAKTSIILEAHEYVCPQRLLSQWSAPEMQRFLKRMAPRLQYWP